MLDKALIYDVLTESLSTGGDFAEIFVENNLKNNISMVNGIVEKSLSGIDYGVGIRVFDGYNAVYVYTNDTSRENLLQVARNASIAVKKNQITKVLNFLNYEYENINKIKMLPSDVEKKRKVEIMRIASNAAFQYDSCITETTINYADSTQDVLIANSEGVFVTDRRVRTRLAMEAIASSETEKQSGFWGPGASMGFELFDKIDVTEYAKDAARSAVTMLKAKFCPSGTMPVIIDNGFGGVIFHEACGHSLEATAVAKKASVFTDKMGQQIASSCVSAVDDGTLSNEWGTLNVDDEGTKTQRNLLIENGILKSYLVDKLNGKKMNMKSTGSSRRESYRYAPTSRMNNTFILDGKDNKEDIIANTENGLYAKYMGGGSVNPGTGDFNFSVREAYLIKNGKIGEPVRGATLIGKGSEVLMNIDKVANNLSQAQGMCGSVSGSIPTNVGQPLIRVKQLTVGGRG